MRSTRVSVDILLERLDHILAERINGTDIWSSRAIASTTKQARETFFIAEGQQRLDVSELKVAVAIVSSTCHFSSAIANTSKRSWSCDVAGR